MKRYFVYILASKPNGTLYIGSTTNLIKRIWQHKNKIILGFTSKYNVNQLVYYEEHINILEAAKRERRLKEWPRMWKINLIREKIQHGKICIVRLFVRSGYGSRA